MGLMKEKVGEPELLCQCAEECKGKMKRIVKLYNAETGNILHIGYAEDE